MIKNLLIDPPGYSYVKPISSEYSMALLKLATVLKQRGESVQLFDFMPRKAFTTNYWTRNGGSFYRYFETPHKKYRSYRGQELEYDGAVYQVRTEDYISRLGATFNRIYNGADLSIFRKFLKENKPDRIWVSSGITYHWRGTKEAIEVCKEMYPDVEVILGGVYPTLCPDHAQAFTDADRIISGPYLDIENVEMDLGVLPNPPEFIIRQFSKGCPNKCKFCSVTFLDGAEVKTVDVKKDVAEIVKHCKEYGIHNLKLWGSNMLLPERGKVFEEWLDRLIAEDLKLNIACPEGFAPELLTLSVCRKAAKVGFIGMIVPLEAGSDNRLCSMSKKYGIGVWKDAVEMVHRGGFRRDQVWTTAILGTPGQTEEEIIELIRLCNEMRVRVVSYPYTPVPRSEWYEESKYLKSIDLEHLAGELYPVVKDRNLLVFLLDVQRVLTDDDVVENYKKRESFLERVGKKEDVMDKDIISKIARVVVDLADQSLEINAGIKKLLGKVENIEKRVAELEEKLGAKV